MSWRLKIVHTTRFAYDSAAHASYNEARLTPPTLLTQTTLESRIEIEPAAPVYRYHDYWAHARVGVRPRRRALRTRRHRHQHRRDHDARTAPRAVDQLARAAAPHHHRPVRRVPRADHPHGGRRRTCRRGARACARPVAERDRLADLVLDTRRGRIRARLDRRADQCARSVAPPPRRLPRHRPPLCRPAAALRHSGPLRLGLRAPQARCGRSARQSKARAMRGSNGGTAIGSATMSPMTSPSASNMLWLLEVATMAMSRRSKAFTRAGRRVGLASPSKSPG